MYIIFNKESKKVIKILGKEPVAISNTLEIARCANNPTYNEAIGEYLTVTNLQEKTEKYIDKEYVEKEIEINEEDLSNIDFVISANGMAIVKELVEVEKERPYYTCDLVVNESPNKAELIERQYENKVSALIRKKYSLNAELAILRQRDTKPEEYQAYNEYAEQCKAIAKQEFGI